MSWGETLFLKKIIDGTKGLVKSDNLYITKGPSTQVEILYQETKELPFKIKFKWSGSCKISLKIKTGDTSALAKGTITFYINGSPRSYVSFEPNSGAGTEIREIITDVSVNKGDVCSFACTRNYSGTGGGSGDYYTILKINSVNIYADIIDTSGAEIQNIN